MLKTINQYTCDFCNSTISFITGKSDQANTRMNTLAAKELKGWFQLRLDDNRPDVSLHFCSEYCMDQHMKKLNFDPVPLEKISDKS